MARQTRKEKNAWDKFSLWMHENQKVIWVLLLIIIAPTFAATGLLSNFFQSWRDQAVVDIIYSRPITHAEVTLLNSRLGAVGGTFPVFNQDMTYLYGPHLQIFSDLRGQDFEMYKEKARRLGLRVSDAELSQRIKDLWQHRTAEQYAVDRYRSLMSEQPKNPGLSQQFDAKAQMEAREAKDKRLEQLQAARAFDQASWLEMINPPPPPGDPENQRKRKEILPREFEETLRDILLVRKLQEYIDSAVKVSPEEIYSDYNKEEQKRKLSWSEFKVPDALKEMVAKKVKSEDLKIFYEMHKEDLFKKPYCVKANWLLVPSQHFKEEVTKNVKDEDLQKYYTENRNPWRRPGTLFGWEAQFAVLKPEERAERDALLYQPLDEVKEKVREKLIEKNTQEALRDFSDKLRLRINPPKPPATDATRILGDKPAATLDELVKEYPFLKTGSTGFVTKEEAKTAFGDGFSTRVDSWFAEQMSPRNEKPKLQDPRVASETEKGSIFYKNVSDRLPTTPSMRDIEAEVRTAYVEAQALEALKKSLLAVSQEINDGKKDLASVIQNGIDVEAPISPGDKEEKKETVHVAALPLETASNYESKDGVLKVAKPKKDAAEKAMEEKKEEAMDDSLEADLDSSEIPPGEKPIRVTGFAIRDKQKTDVAASAKPASCFLVRFDDVVYPDREGFESARAGLENKLLGEKQRVFFQKWHLDLIREATGAASASSQS